MKNNDKTIQEEVEESEEEEETKGVRGKEIKELNQKVEEFETKYKRALADYQNLEKRVADQRLDLIKGANKDLLLRLLPILDTLVLANQHVENDGLQVSINQFLDTLK